MFNPIIKGPNTNKLGLRAAYELGVSSNPLKDCYGKNMYNINKMSMDFERETIAGIKESNSQIKRSPSYWIKMLEARGLDYTQAKYLVDKALKK